MLNKDALLKQINSGLDVFKHYIRGQWRVGRNFLNLLYEDRKASCNIYYDRRSQSYKMKDFGNDAYSGDCFDIVGKIKGLDCNNPKDFVEILKTVNRDLSLGIDENDRSFAVPVSHGFHAICFNSETSNIPQNIIKKLSYRFKHIVLLYDMDKTGLGASLKHAQQLSDSGVKRWLF
jgi:hypothetical protein